MNTTPRGTRPATKSQQDLILTLAAERPTWQEILSGTAYERTYDVTTGSGKSMTMPEASEAIRALLAIPKARKAGRGRAAKVTPKSTFSDALSAMRQEVPMTPVTPVSPATPAEVDVPPAILDQRWTEGDVMKDQMGRLWVVLRLAPEGEGLNLTVMGASGADRARKCTLAIPNRVIRAEKAEGPDAEWARELARDAWRAGARW